MKKTKKYLLLAIILVMLILFGIQRIVYKQQYKINSYSLAIFVDGEKKDTYPERGNYNVSVDCMGKANGSWDYNNWGPIIKNFNDGAACNIIFTTGKKFNEYIIDASKTDSNIIYIEQPDTVQTGSNAKEEYRYTGANPNNYVYFGCDNNCTEDNLYRIIGVIPTESIEGGTYEKRVKLIKASAYQESESGLLLDSPIIAGKKGYRWNNVVSNAFENSSIANTVLNGVYWNSLNNYQKYLDKSIWYLGASKLADYLTYTANNYYLNERSSVKGYSQGALNYKAYIGLMYPSDYGYAATTFLHKKSIIARRMSQISENWLYNLQYNPANDSETTYVPSGEWLISPESTYADKDGVPAYSISSFGGVEAHQTTYVNFVFDIRPTFYLKENVLYQNGLGTKESPYRIMLGES